MLTGADGWDGLTGQGTRNLGSAGGEGACKVTVRTSLNRPSHEGLGPRSAVEAVVRYL
jgi:hypothetical protein